MLLAFILSFKNVFVVIIVIFIFVSFVVGLLKISKLPQQKEKDVF